MADNKTNSESSGEQNSEIKCNRSQDSISSFTNSTALIDSQLSGSSKAQASIFVNPRNTGIKIEKVADAPSSFFGCQLLKSLDGTLEASKEDNAQCKLPTCFSRLKPETLQDQKLFTLEPSEHPITTSKKNNGAGGKKPNIVSAEVHLSERKLFTLEPKLTSRSHDQSFSKKQETLLTIAPDANQSTVGFVVTARKPVITENVHRPPKPPDVNKPFIPSPESDTIRANKQLSVTKSSVADSIFKPQFKVGLNLSPSHQQKIVNPFLSDLTSSISTKPKSSLTAPETNSKTIKSVQKTEAAKHSTKTRPSVHKSAKCSYQRQAPYPTKQLVSKSTACDKLEVSAARSSGRDNYAQVLPKENLRQPPAHISSQERIAVFALKKKASQPPKERLCTTSLEGNSAKTVIDIPGFPVAHSFDTLKTSELSPVSPAPTKHCSKPHTPRTKPNTDSLVKQAIDHNIKPKVNTSSDDNVYPLSKEGIQQNLHQPLLPRCTDVCVPPTVDLQTTVASILPRKIGDTRKGILPLQIATVDHTVPDRSTAPIDNLQSSVLEENPDQSGQVSSITQVQTLPTENQSLAEEITEVIPLPLLDEQQLAILISHPKVVAITEVANIYITVGSDKCLIAHVSGFTQNVIVAVNTLQSIATNICKPDEYVTKDINCGLKVIPLLCSNEELQKLLAFQQETNTRIAFVRQDGHPPVDLLEFADRVSSRPRELLLRKIELKELLHLGVGNIFDYRWVEIDDSKQVSQIPDPVDTILKQQSESGSQRHSFEYGGNIYTVDFESSFLYESNTGMCHHIQKMPPLWLVHVTDSGCFLPHPHSDDIENFFQYGGKYIDTIGNRYTFTFKPHQSFQVDVQTGNKVEIKRYPPPPFFPEHAVTVRVSGQSDSVDRLDKYMTNLSCTMSRHSFDSVLPSSVSDKRELFVAQIMNIARQFFVSCLVPNQVPASNNITIVLEGVDKYVEQVHSLLLKRMFESQQHFLAMENLSKLQSNYPDFWEPQTESFELKCVPKGGDEWDKILRLIQVTIPTVKMEKLQRVQNKPLWEKYSLECQQMKDRNNGVLNEMRLFHGTKQTDPKDVVSKPTGIDFRYSRQDGQLMWGTGVYFAVKAVYSDRYAHSVNSSKQMILASVLTGKSFKCPPDSKLTKPPPLPDSSGNLYDTVNGETGDSQVYTVYNHDRSYPEYIITYSK